MFYPVDLPALVRRSTNGAFAGDPTSRAKKKRTFRLRLALAVLIAVCLVGASRAVASGHHQRQFVNLTFDKSAAAPGVWRGAVAGDISGHLETRLLSMHGTGPVFSVEILWIVSAEEMSFTAKAGGTLNTETAVCACKAL